MNYSPLFEKYGKKYGVDPALLEAVTRQESAFNPNATSPVGARGLMQIMPATARQPGFGITPVDPEALYDPETNVKFGANYLAKMLQKYGGDTEAALAAYNAGAGNADKWLKAGRDYAAFPDRKQTEGYTRNILGNYKGGGVQVASNDDDAGWEALYQELQGAAPPVPVTPAAQDSAPQNDDDAGWEALYQELQTAKPLSGQISVSLAGDLPRQEELPEAGTLVMQAEEKRSKADKRNIFEKTGASLLNKLTLGYAGNDPTELISQYAGATSDAARINVLRQIDPNLTYERDKSGNVIVNVGGKRAYLNAPGISQQDIADVGKELIYALPFAAGAGALTKGAGLATRVGAQAIAGAAAPAARDVASTVRTGTLDATPEDYLLGAAFGGVGEAVLPGLAKQVKRVFKNAKYFDKATGGLSEAGAKKAVEMGADPEALGEYASRVLFDAAELGDEAAVRAAEFAQEGITPTRGQVTGTARDAGFEIEAAKGAYGEGARTAVLDALESQKRQISERARAGAGGAFTPSVSPSQSYLSASEGAGLAIGEKAAQAKTAIKEAYDATDLSKVDVDINDLTGLDDYVRNRAMVENPDLQGLDSSLSGNVNALYPATLRALDRVKNLVMSPQTYKGGASKDIAVPGLSEGGAITRVSFDALELTRKALNNTINAATNTADKRGAVAVKRAFDDYVQEGIERGIFGGDAKELAKIKNARSLRAEYGRLYESDDAVGRFIQKVIDPETGKSPAEIAGFLYGQTKIGASSNGVNLFKRFSKIFGSQAPETDMLREGLVLKLTHDQTGGLLTPYKIGVNISRFVEGEGARLANEMFTKKQLQALKRFGRTVGKLNYPENLQNRSNTAAAVTRNMRDLFAVAGLPGGLETAATGFAGRSVLDFAKTLRAKAAAAGILPKGGTGLGAGVSGVGGREHVKERKK